MSSTKRILFLIFITLFSFKGFSQVLPKRNEELIFSFKTIDNQKIGLSINENENYIVLRIYNEQSELIFPKELNEKSWEKFQYSYWFRGGGINNSGLYLNYLYFTEENLKYICIVLAFPD